MLKRIVLVTFFGLFLSGVAYGQRECPACDSREEQRLAARDPDASRIRTRGDAQADLNAAIDSIQKAAGAGNSAGVRNAFTKGDNAVEELQRSERLMPEARGITEVREFKEIERSSRRRPD